MGPRNEALVFGRSPSGGYVQTTAILLDPGYRRAQVGDDALQDDGCAPLCDSELPGVFSRCVKSAITELEGTAKVV